MQNQLNPSLSTQKNYDFIDSIRCIAMLIIVLEHCIAEGGISLHYYDNLYWTFLIMMQFTKFATIAFFLLGGFLLGDKFTQYSASQYYKRRLSNTLLPWLFWSLLYIMIDTLKLAIMHPSSLNWHSIWVNIRGLYTLSSYWFIINFMISIGILLIFKRYLYSWVFGLVLGSFTAFYAINIYNEWIPTNHTIAILGFVFFLWIGAQMRKHWQILENHISKTPLMIILVFVVATFWLALNEADKLDETGVDPINTLRYSNILYSLACFLLLLKVKKYIHLSFLKPRQTTYGIYLIHFILIVFFVPMLFRPLQIHLKELTPTQFILYRSVFFAITYAATFLIVLLISKSKAKNLIGN